MTLFLGDQVIQRVDDLSEHGRHALHFIDGGAEWLRWAIAARSVTYTFADESILAGGLQQGLHGSPFALLPTLGLAVSPVKLMTLKDSELRVFAGIESGQDAGPKAIALAQRICGDHELLTMQDLALGDGFLEALGASVSNAPVFQIKSLADRRAIYALARQVYPDDAPPAVTDQDKAAAVFAVGEARTPLEFVDYFQVYRDLAAKAPTKTGSKTDSSDDRAKAAVHTLLPLMFWALNCPEVPALVGPEEVGQAVTTWVQSGKAVGFARLSAGVREIVAHTLYGGEKGGRGARDYVAGYLRASRVLLDKVPVSRGLMGQDGATCVYPLEAGDCEGSLLMDPNGVISLSTFRRKPRQKSSFDDPFSFSNETELEQAS